MRRVKKKKEVETQRVALPTPSRTADALIGDTKQNGNEEKEGNSDRAPNPVTLIYIYIYNFFFFCLQKVRRKYETKTLKQT